MATTIARAHSLAAQISAATSVAAEIEHGVDAVTVRIELPGGFTGATWDAVLLALLSLPVGDRVGGERTADGRVRVWAILRDNLSMETSP